MIGYIPPQAENSVKVEAHKAGACSACTTCSTDTPEPPTLDAYAIIADDGTPLWKVWCDHCRIWHTHAAEPGHRVAHCFDRVDGWGKLKPPSPYVATGYVLRYAGEWSHDLDKRVRAEARARRVQAKAEARAKAAAAAADVERRAR